MSLCIVCSSPNVEIFLDLGQMALANKFLTAAELASNAEPKFPLRVGACRVCGHVQLAEHVPPSSMFDNYLYISSASETLVKHLQDLSRAVTQRLSLTSTDLVVDIGSNDGTLLASFRQASPVRTLGIDPAENLASLARKNGIAVHTAYFNPITAKAVRDAHGSASVITMTNVFPHIPDLHSLIEGIDLLLADDGTLVIEAHYLGDLIDMHAFDTIYHEHVSYWALGPMMRLFSEHNFEIIDVERLPVHHGQLRAWIRRKGSDKPSSRVAELAAEEIRRKLTDISTLSDFTLQIERNKVALRSRVAQIHKNGDRIVGYGAPAKGNTLLSFFEFGPNDIEYIADRNTLKQGRLTPGTHIPVVSADRILNDRPEYVLILAWNFADEIVRQQAEYRRGGGRFLIPIPEVYEI